MNFIDIVQKKVNSLDVNLWAELKEKSLQYKKYLNENAITQIQVKEKVWLLFGFFADLHFGNIGTDYTTAQTHAEMVGECPYAYGINGGDNIDNFIRTKIISAIIEAQYTPEQQIKLFQEYVKFFKGKMILLLGGNHDAWTKAVSGIDWLKLFAEKNKIVYHPEEIRCVIDYGSHNYRFLVKHKTKYNSSFNVTHALKQQYRMGDWLFDVGVGCHLHTPALEDCFLQNRHVIVARTGSYKIHDSFGKVQGYNEAKPIMPCVAVSPHEKRMVSFFHLEEGIDFVNFKNRSLK